MSFKAAFQSQVADHIQHTDFWTGTVAYKKGCIAQAFNVEGELEYAEDVERDHNEDGSGTDVILVLRCETNAVRGVDAVTTDDTFTPRHGPESGNTFRVIRHQGDGFGWQKIWGYRYAENEASAANFRWRRK